MHHPGDASIQYQNKDTLRHTISAILLLIRLDQMKCS